MKPAVAADRKKVRPPAAVAAGAPDIGHFDMPETCFPTRTRWQGLIASPGLTLFLAGVTLSGCSGGDFGRTGQDFLNDDMHRWIGGEATGSVGLEERVRRLRSPSITLAAESGVRPHRLWPHPDRRAAPLAFVALCAADGRRARRHHPVRAVLRQCRARDRS